MALDYMHSINIMHRDLKPENLLIEEREADGHITVKLTDFGFATKYEPDEMQKNPLGSPAYMAPELFKKLEYDNKVDIWAAGVIAFRLLSGERPFKGKFFDQIKYEICSK